MDVRKSEAEDDDSSMWRSQTVGHSLHGYLKASVSIVPEGASLVSV